MRRRYFLTLMCSVLVIMSVATNWAAGDPPVTLYPVQDAWVSQAYPSTSFGHAPVMQIGYIPEPFDDSYEAYIRFDLSPIPQGAIIQVAKLQVYCTENHSYYSSGVTDFDIFHATQYWDESVTWTTKPTYDSTGPDFISIHDVPRWYESEDDELEKYVQQWVDGSLPNYGFALVHDGGPQSAYALLTSRHADSGDATYQPRLVVTYYIPPPQPELVNHSALPSTITLGEKFTVDVTLQNNGRTADTGGISVSFPDIYRPYSPANAYLTWQSTGLLSIQDYWPQELINDKFLGPKEAEYLLLEGSKSGWAEGQSESITVEVEPLRTGPFLVNVRGWLTEGAVDYEEPATSLFTDQQSYPVLTHEVRVRSAAPPGVTVITHGYQRSWSDCVFPPWVDVMGRAIARRAGGTVFRYDPPSGVWDYVTGSKDPAAELVLLFDWCDESDTVNTGYAQAAGDALFAALREPVILEPIPGGTGKREIPAFQSFDLLESGRGLHLIGHSRGTIVNSQAWRRIIEYVPEKVVNHVTLLDPHQAMTGYEDPMPFLWSGKYQWADNYYQDTFCCADTCSMCMHGDLVPVPSCCEIGEIPVGFNCCGQLVGGAVNVRLPLLDHVQVHRWYHGTIDLRTSSDGEGIIYRDDWYEDHNGYLDGFYYAQAGEGWEGRPGNTWGNPTLHTAYPIDGFFNGDFNLQNSVGDTSEAGWRENGGVGTGMIANGKLTLHRDRPTRSHNRLYVPVNAVQLWLDLKIEQAVAPASTFRIVFRNINGDPEHPWTPDVVFEERTTLPAPHHFEIPEADRGRVGTVTLELTDGGGLLPTEVWVDNIKFSIQEGSPTIMDSPDDSTVCAGGTATFQIAATGTGTLHYQWHMNGSHVGTDSSSLTLQNVQYSINGAQIACDVTDVNGATSSPAATLTVHAPPAFTDHPDSQTVCLGQPVTLSVAISGDPAPSLQWRKDGLPISGAKQQSYPINQVTNGHAGTYDVVAVNECAPSGILTQPAVLIVKPPPLIAFPPQNETTPVGSPAAFCVVPGGVGPFTFQWRKNGVDIPNKRDQCYSISSVTSDDAGQYSVIVANDCEPAEESMPATLTVTTASCGDNTCDTVKGETPCNCAQDCGSHPSSEASGSTCADGIDNDCDGRSDCADPDCATATECRCPDQDEDGVCDSQDDCPNTVHGAMVDSGGCPFAIPGDFDHDGDVDEADGAIFSACCVGSAIPTLDGCEAKDLDPDGDVDQDDFGLMQRCFSGQNNPGDPGCLAGPNTPPTKPALVSPSNGATGVSLQPTLQASAFSDPNGNPHTASQWQVDNNADFSSPEWDSGEAEAGTQATVPSGMLAYSTTYYWRVLYKDHRGSWSDPSDVWSFTTANDTLTLDLGGGVSLVVVQIPAGTFMMGSLDGVGAANEKPQHQVTISQSFYMGKYEVTQAQWRAVMGTSPSNFPGDSNPVEKVSYDDCLLFCSAVQSRTGVAVRLPTEAEWEYACRAGSDTAYYYGDNVSQLGSFAWYHDNSDSTTHPSGQKTPNAWGLYDMHGNVWEWCADYWHSNYEGAPNDGAAWLTGGDSTKRVARGGSWYDGDDLSRCAYRTCDTLTYKAYAFGFRVALSARPAKPTLVSPSDGATGIGLTPTLQASTFSDPNGDTHAASRWQVGNNSDFSSPEWDSDVTAATTQTTVPSGKLSYSTTYYWRVLYQDNRGDWSAPSDVWSFTTAPGNDVLTLDLEGGQSLVMVGIPQGTFMMGSPGEQGYSDEHPQHQVTIQSFYIGKSEVTQAQWQAIMGNSPYPLNNPSAFHGDNRPVEQVSWNDCQQFCQKASAKTERTIRLPTEAQWEYACRATKTTQYYFGDDQSLLGQHAWYEANCGETQDINGKRYNPWGLHDVYGNVWEWCQDWFGNYEQDPQYDPTGSATGTERILRGGSWCHYLSNDFRSALRYSTAPGNSSYNIGFRVVLIISPSKPTLVSPSDGATGIGLTPTLQASAFSDPNGNPHTASQWQVDNNADFSSPEWDSGAAAATTQTTVPSGRLSNTTTYYWRVCYRNSQNAWSAWSDYWSFTTAFPDGSDPVLWSGNGHYYQRIDVSCAWTQAKSSSESLLHAGKIGHLATITSQAENAFVADQLLRGTRLLTYWLGGCKVNGWQWVTGEAWVFVNWNPGEPSNSNNGEDSLEVYSESTGLLGGWNDRKGTTVDPGGTGYIVEYE